MLVFLKSFNSHFALNSFALEKFYVILHQVDSVVSRHKGKRFGSVDQKLIVENTPQIYMQNTWTEESAYKDRCEDMNEFFYLFYRIFHKCILGNYSVCGVDDCVQVISLTYALNTLKDKK